MKIMINFVDIDSDFKLELETLRSLIECCRPSPRTLAVSLLLENGEWEQLLSLTIEPLNYTERDFERFQDDYLVTVFLSKSPNVPLNVDRKVEAIKSFYKAESHCADYTRSFLTTDPNGPVGRKLKGIKRVFQDMLGPCTSRALRRIERNQRFGPGATTSVPGSGTTIADKYADTPHLTESLYPFYKVLLGDRWHEHAKHPEIVKGNEFFSVEKNAKTERGACKEPDLNQRGQLALGSELRQRLSSVGNPIKYQKVNQDMVRRAYADNLSTIDLSSASDTISLILVLFLLPQKWKEIFGLFRCEFTRIPCLNTDGSLLPDLFRWHRLSKYSSMGNGFTFELETMIFLAIARYIVPPERWDDVAVYGDDMIVPSSYYHEVCDALADCGFIVNQKKSFSSGLFFESCGTDYFCGRPVRPFYARGRNGKDGQKAYIPYALQLANALRLYARRVTDESHCDRRYLPAYQRLAKLVPKDWRQCKVPSSLGDTGLISTLNEARFNIAPSLDGWEGVWCNTLELDPVKRKLKSFGFYLSRLAMASKLERSTILPKGEDKWTGGILPVRGWFKKRMKPVLVFVSDWDSNLNWS